MHEAYKPLGAVSIILTWAVLGSFIVFWQSDKTKTFSKNAAANSKSFFLLALTQTLALPMFVAFSLLWFSPKFQLPTLFDVLIVFSALGYLIAAWLPDTNQGWKSAVHGISAYSAALIMIPITVLISLSENLGDIPRAFSYVVLAYMILSISSYLSTKWTKERALYAQGLYVFLFHLLILSAAYIT